MQKVKSSSTSESLFLQQQQSIVNNVTDVLLKVLFLSNVYCTCWTLYQVVLNTLRFCKVSCASQKWVLEQFGSPRSLARNKKTSQATAVPFGWVKKFFPSNWVQRSENSDLIILQSKVILAPEMSPNLDQKKTITVICCLFQGSEPF